MARTPAKPEEICEVFIDESSQTKNRYLILGGIVFDGINREAIFDHLRKARLPELPQGEMKWGKVSKGKLAAYKRVIDAFWDCQLAKNIHFHCLVADSSKFDHAKWNSGSQEIGFSKEVFQLAFKFSRIYQGLFHIFLDERNTGQKTEELRLILNNSARKKGDKRDWPFRRCHFRKSDICPALQLVDIFIGAIGYHMNGHIAAKEASPAKTELANHILKRAGLKSASIDTGIRGKFTIWHRKLR